MQLCRHARYKKIDWIKEPKYSTDEILISVQSIDPNFEHYLIKFTQCKSVPDWFYMDYKTISSSPKQKNGRGEVYVVSMSKREPFEAIKNCEHEI